jgi:5-methyltetrahydrofolate--homocysteine methyltransferase
MYPAASVSGYVFAQKDAQYFNVGKIQQDQVEEYAVRKGQTIDTIKKLLPMNT